jgi:hypothetical protein
MNVVSVRRARGNRVYHLALRREFAQGNPAPALCGFLIRVATSLEALAMPVIVKMPRLLGPSSCLRSDALCTD